MAKKYEVPGEVRPTLKVPRDEAVAKVNLQIAKAKALLALPVQTSDQLASANLSLRGWRKYTEDLVKNLIDPPMFADREIRGRGHYKMKPTPQEEIQEFVEDVGAYIHSLESIRERLELFHEVEGLTSQRVTSNSPSLSDKKRIFVVHGHDEAVKQEVARVIEKLELEPIILHEQPNKGRTIIEKFEDHAEVGFAVILLTADDFGNAKGAAGQNPRARQNVILELGYFIGKLGRARVCALYQRGVELPSDMSGVVYTPLDGAWQFALAKELRAAKYDVDMNKL